MQEVFGSRESMILKPSITFSSKRFSDLPKEKVQLTLVCSLEQFEPVSSITIHKDDEPHTCGISFTVRHDFENWKQLWSIVEYSDEFKRIVEAKATPLIFFRL